MVDQITQLNTPLFAGIRPEERESMLHCTGYYVSQYQKGQPVALEQEHIRHIGIVLEGAVDMIKEDIWGNKTILARIGKDDLFGETFACGSDSLSVVSFVVSKDAKVLFMPFCKAMHTCSNGCEFHQRLVDNMVRIIAGTLLKVGGGHILPEEIERIIEGKDRQLAGPTAPAKGLTLVEIRYPDYEK